MYSIFKKTPCYIKQVAQLHEAVERSVDEICRVLYFCHSAGTDMDFL